MMADQPEPHFFQTAREGGKIVTADPPKFDLESYIANYKGKTRFQRLYHIGITSSFLYADSLKAAIAEAKAGKDVRAYELAVAALYEINPSEPGAVLDTAWVDRTNQRVKADTMRLDAELRGYKNNLIKESIRMGYDDLGRHYHEIGHLTEASKAYAKEREFCLQPSHVSVLTLKFINVHIDQKNWLNVETNVHKLRNLYQKDDDRAKIEPKLHAAMGLALMSTGKYGDAARSFIDTDPRMLQAKLDDPGDGEAYNEVMTPNDVAVYGGLCALATMDRTTLQRLVLDNSNFRSFLELEPHVRRAISFFISGKYSACLSILEAYKTDYLLDVHLSRHVTELYARIHSKAIVQYFVPFSRVTLNALAGAFNTDEQSIESTLADMIGNGTLDARLDLETKTLVATRIDERSKVHDDALVMAKSYERTAQLRILRMEIINAGLEVKSPKAQAPMGTFGPTLTGNYSPEVMAGADGRSKGFNAKF